MTTLTVAPTMGERTVKVGVGVLVLRADEVLLGRRLGAHGVGMYCGPGGHVEHGETLEEAAYREITEECGPNLVVTELRPLCVSTLLCYPPKHYVDVGFSARWVSGGPVVTESDRVESWDWWPLDGLPLRSQLFVPVATYLDCLDAGLTVPLFSFEEGAEFCMDEALLDLRSALRREAAAEEERDEARTHLAAMQPVVDAARALVESWRPGNTITVNGPSWESARSLRAAVDALDAQPTDKITEEEGTPS